MFTQSIIVALIVYLFAAVISFFVAWMIKGIFISIRLRKNIKFNSAPVLTKPLSH